MPSFDTVIIALKFEGDAILGADSQASDTFQGVKWEVEKPFQVPGFPCVTAMSGSEGMNTRVKEDIVERQWHQHAFDKISRVRGTLDTSFKKVYEEIKSRNGHIPLMALSVFWAEDDARIMEHGISRDCCFHPYFHAIGSGGKTAYAIYRTLGGPELIGVNEEKAIQAAFRCRSSVR